MKILIVILFSILTLSCSKELVSDKKTGYYFCYSHKVKFNDHTTSHSILYTDVMTIQDNELIKKEKAREWGDIVKTRCKNKGGCTSDLMYYHTLQQAEANLLQVFDNYKDAGKYKLEKIEFE